MVKIETWNDPKHVCSILSKKLKYSKDVKKIDSSRWDEADSICYNMGLRSTPGISLSGTNQGTSFTGLANASVNQPTTDVSMTYAFKNLRFIHAQMCANPPIAAPRPTNSDLKSKQAANCCDRLIRYGMRHYKMQETIDLIALDCLQYGTGIGKTIWNRELGDVIGADPMTGTCTMEGDFELTVVNPRQFYMDPDANHPSEIRYAFQEYVMPVDEACYKFGKEAVEKIKDRQQKKINFADMNHQDTVVVYEYWEKGMPLNGFLGRYVICDEEGHPLMEPTDNPHKLGKGGKIKKAYLPFHVFTDIDVPHRLWGKSFLDYTIPLQDSMNRLDTVMLDALEAHAVYRMVLPEGCEVASDSVGNSNWDILKVTGNQGPHFVTPPSMPPDMSRYRDQIRSGIDDMSGVNESMFGQQSRETSGFSAQYNVNQGSMIRRRLFNKFAMLTESIYNHYLQVLADRWTNSRTISVVGKEKAMDTLAISGADIQDGYELIVEYGTNLSLDPITRREEIMSLSPLFEKANMPAVSQLKLMRLNDTEGMFDELALAEDRQREYFEEMIASPGKYVAPGAFEMHAPMIEFAIKYRMSADFKGLKPNIQANILRHLVERAAMGAEEQRLISSISGQQTASAVAPESLAGGTPPAAPPPVAPV
jgi:hypothetical protein